MFNIVGLKAKYVTDSPIVGFPDTLQLSVTLYFNKEFSKPSHIDNGQFNRLKSTSLFLSVTVNPLAPKTFSRVNR